MGKDSIDYPRGLLLCLAAAAAIIGLYARFKGLGIAPFSVDEYYLGRSTGNVLHTGLPAFPCGGFYTRGLVEQYLTAGLRLLGMTPELAPRALAGFCSLLLLPAVYWLGKRIDGVTVGLLSVIVLLLSVWEIEMARFGRMYAPFQPVCGWYLVFLVRYCVDGRQRAFYWMLALSILAPLVWEGGVLLALLNLVPLFLPASTQRPWTRTDYQRLLAALLIVALALLFVKADFRGENAAAFPPGFSRDLAIRQPAPLSAFAAAFRQLPGYGWYLLAIVPLAGIALALRRIRDYRQRPMVAAALLAMLGGAAAHQFAIVIMVLVLLLLTGHLTWRELCSKSWRIWHIAVLICLLYWVLYGLVLIDWSSGGLNSLSHKIAAFCYAYISFPDFAGVVAQPWARAVPLLALGLTALIGIAIVDQARSTGPLDARRTLLIAFVVLVMAASASHPPRQETRYVFFLYPLAVIIAISAIARLTRFIVADSRRAALVTSAVTLGAFAVSEDFQPRHLRAIDSPTELYRSNMNVNMQAHLEIRNDYRAMAAWLQQRSAPGDVVINGVHGLDFYYPQIGYFFTDERNGDFPDWSCRHGTVERWGSYPLLYTVQSLAAVVAASHDAYLIFYPDNNPGLLESLAAFSPKIAWTQGYVSIAILHGSPQAELR